jgi:type II secretory pathway pseudopilin PulG
MNKKSLLAIFASLSAIAQGLAFPQVSTAFTIEEFTQTIGQIHQVSEAYQRYLQDLEKIRRGSSNVNTKPIRRQVEPEVPAQTFPSDNDLIEKIELFEIY